MQSCRSLRLLVESLIFWLFAFSGNILVVPGRISGTALLPLSAEFAFANDCAFSVTDNIIGRFNFQFAHSIATCNSAVHAQRIGLVLSEKVEPL